MPKLEDEADLTKDFTKTKAKRCLIVILTNKDNKNIIQEVKKKYDISIIKQFHGANDLTTQKSYLFELKTTKEALNAKSFMIKSYKDAVNIKSVLIQKKKLDWKLEKESRKEANKAAKPFEKHGQFGDRSRNLFEIRIPKLILRNLSYKTKEEELKQELEKFGKIEKLDLIQKEGKFAGFGFVTFEKKADAAKALETLNSNEFKVDNKKITADWCLPKDLYLKNQSKEQEETFKESDQKVEISKEASDNEEISGDDDDEQRNDDEKAKDEDKKEEKQVADKLKIKQKAGTKDILEKRTIFLRNLSFDTTEDHLRDVLSKYGQIKYCKICMDRDLERPRGTAFVQFEEAEAALQACAESNILELDSRRIQVDLALARNTVHDLVEEKKTKEPKDNRNLSLAKEGVIYPNSYEAKELSKLDMEKRLKIEASNAAKLKILHYFVSPTRLSVHNLPVKVTDEEMRKIFWEALGDMKGKKILECRIMRDLTRVNSEGVAKSRGYGFVEFATYEQAHKALHATNNNPNLFDDKKTRLIVQFSIEDIRKLKARQLRFEKQNARKGLPPVIKKSKKSLKKVDSDEQHLDAAFDDIDKIKEKNLMRVHSIEKKLNKRKVEEDKKKDARRLKRARVDAPKKQSTKVVKPSVKRKRVKQHRPRVNIKDATDDLIDKYMQKKTTSKKRKWFE